MPENAHTDTELRVSEIRNGPPYRNGGGVEMIMRWVRMLLPMAIAGIGWYLGHTVGQFEKRLEDLTLRVGSQEIACASRESENAVKFFEIERRLTTTEQKDIRDHQNLININQYHRDLDQLRDDIKTLEESHKK